MDVKAKRYVEYDNEEELKAIIPTLSGEVLHIGGGSNLLFKGDFDGTVPSKVLKNCQALKFQLSIFNFQLLKCWCV